MPEIHQTAIVDESAELGNDVVVGPYSIIEGGVTIGNNTRIDSHVVIRRHTSIGEDNRLHQFCSIGDAPQHQGFRGEPTRLEIGDRNIIREYATLNRGTADHLGLTRIGDDNFIMAYSHIAHDCILGNNIIMANAASLAGHVDIGDFAILGGFTVVHQFVKIGQHCITGLGSICLQDVPPYVVASGNPAKPYGINVKGLRRRNFSNETIKLLNIAYRLVYRRNLNLQTAIGELDQLDGENNDLNSFSDFLRHSERGIIR